jgi:multidrug efflux system membrane fusion protein
MGARLGPFIRTGLAGLALWSVAGGVAWPQDDTYTVALQSIDDRKAVFATVESVDETRARARIGGTLSELKVDEGSWVEVGQRLATVKDPKLPLQLAALDARRESLAAQEKLASTELDRITRLRRSGTASQARLDAAQTEFNVVKGELAAIVAERAVVAQQVKEGAVLAPVTGRVLKVPVTEGTVIMPGETVAVIASDTYVLRLHLPERHARFIHEGDEVLIGERGLQGGTAPLQKATIRQVYPEMVNGQVVADVTASGIGDYFVGERTRVFVATGKRQAIVVPKKFLYQKFGVTFAKLKSGAEVTVQVGMPVPGGIEVLSGLKPGDELVAP